jgi:hypothetical protein
MRRAKALKIENVNNYLSDRWRDWHISQKNLMGKN